MLTETIEVCDKFIEHRSEKKEQYNQRGRTDRKFLMDLDAELLEFHKISTGQWFYHPDWRIDAITEEGNSVDVKFIRKYGNVSREKTLNLIRQRDMLDGYLFYEWVSKPGKPLTAGDRIQCRQVGYLPYGAVADSLRKSFKEPDGFYSDVRKLLELHGS